jgi:hypothetical protein
MANETFFLAFALPFPAVVAALTIWGTNDAILTMLSLLIFGFAVPFVVYNKFVGEFSYTSKIPQEILNTGEKISLGIKLLIGSIFGIVIVHALWSMYAPIAMGPATLTLPYPVFAVGQGFYNFLYNFFVWLLLIKTAIAGHVYFNYFTPIEYNEKKGMMSVGGLAPENQSFTANLIISAFVGLLGFAVFYFTVTSKISVIVYALIVFGLNFAALKIRLDKKVIVSVFLVLGLAIGVLLYIEFLKYSSKKNLARKTPEYFFVGNVKNAWTTWFNKNGKK